ncbi:MAG: porin, partial [Pirellulales bacterium]
LHSRKEYTAMRFFRWGSLAVGVTLIAISAPAAEQGDLPSTDTASTRAETNAGNPDVPRQDILHRVGHTLHRHDAHHHGHSHTDTQAWIVSDSAAAGGEGDVAYCDQCGAADLSPCCEAEEDEAWSLFDDMIDLPLLDDWGFSAGGWLSQGFTWNPDSPDNRFNTPIRFNDRANEYQLNQLYFYLERPVNTEGSNWDVGGRFDLLFGTDARFTKALGLDDDIAGSRFYTLALPQLYGEVFAPVGRGLSVKFGHFYTIIGYEVVPAPDNFFYSHAYTMLYAEPFTHTGFLASYPLSDQVTVHGGLTRGWDNFDDPANDLGFLGGVNWTSCDERTTLAFAITTPDDDVPGNDGDRTMYSIVGTRKLTDKLTYVIQHDLGWQDDGAPGGDDAEWYGVNNYLLYDINDCWAAGMRFEWFRDDDAARVPSSTGAAFAGNYFGYTFGLNYKPNANVIVRPEVRWDWTNGGISPFDDDTDSNAFTAGFDVILRY